MDFDETPEEAAFRAEVRTWLEAHAEPRKEGAVYMIDGPDHVKACKDWQRTLYDNGWAGITWPKEYGGRGGPSWQQGIFNEEQSRFDVSTGIFAVGIGMVGPTLITHGTDEQKSRYLDAMLRGDEVWCQLFSEPGAGSDLAGLSTRAIRDGDEWVVNGQKVWNSGAHHSDWGILLTRTDQDAPKHRGITYFVVDMKTPGIDVRPLVQITGQAHFNEVFLTDVRIPHENIVGAVNAGWGVTQTTLMNERTLIGGGGSGTKFDDVLALARRFARTDDPRIRQDLARLYCSFRTLEFLGYRVRTAMTKGQIPGPESSVMKLGYSQHLTRMGDVAMQIMGAHGTLAGDDAYLDGTWQRSFVGQFASKFGGGTDQIQRNICGERVLGLPPEPRPDKNVAFKDIPKG